jgi:hypothetical protein
VKLEFLRVSLCLCASVLMNPSAFAQQRQLQLPSPSADQGEITSREVPATFRTRVNLVLVPVVVRDKEGRPVGNLARDDFQLFDERKPQVITKFAVENAGANPPAPGKRCCQRVWSPR